MTAPTRVDLSLVDGVHVIAFRDRLLFEDKVVREAADQLNVSLPNDGQPLRVVVDFGGVDLVSSSLLGKMILLLRRVEASQGRLVLCELTPNVQTVFKTSNLDKLFPIVRDRTTALAQV